MDESVAHDQLELILNLRRYCKPEGSAWAVQRFLKACLIFVREVMTEEVFLRAMRTAEDGQGLLLFANRVAQLEPLLKDSWPHDFTFSELRDELFGIANGDTPMILSGQPKQGKFRNAHMLLECKLEAIGWYKVLGKVHVPAPDRQLLIMDAYGVSWDAYGKWRKEAIDKLTRDYVERFLFTFVELNWSLAASEGDPVGWAKAQCLDGGLQYRRRLRQAVAE